MTQITRLSARLRSEMLARCGRPTLYAVQEHLYQKQMGQFDPAANWQTMQILELSEMAHRVRDLAATLEADNVVSLELYRLSKEVYADFTAVYDTAMRRTRGEPSMTFFHKENDNDNLGTALNVVT
jgi:hypothetical protein